MWNRFLFTIFVVANLRPSSGLIATKKCRSSHNAVVRHALLPEAIATLPTSSEVVAAAFSVATFSPQVPWLLMILLPSNDITKKLMGGWETVIFASLVHFLIVSTSISEPSGAAPIAEFAGVFDPSGKPLEAMMGMMKYPNFVSEEWSHVLAWDLFVGRFIWLDGLQRGIFTSHSVLLANLIGPPGLLLHFLTCALLKKELPVTELGTAESAVPAEIPAAAIDAEDLVGRLIPGMFTVEGAASLADACDGAVVWENTNEAGTVVGREAVRAMLLRRARAFPADAAVVLDKVADGRRSTGFTWHLAQQGVAGKGLRGTTFVGLSASGEIEYVREVCEPLAKPGSPVAILLRAVAEKAVERNPSLGVRPAAPPRRVTTSAADLVAYLWLEVNGSDTERALEMFDDDIKYEDFNFPSPFVGKDQVRDFLKEFDIPGIKFIPEKISEGVNRCCFTWRVKIGDADAETRGISFYETNEQGTKVTYVRDIAEPLIKPAPLQEFAGLLRPGLRRFNPVP